ncbi:tail fiber domain-containing protein [Stenotrophomonas sp. ATs4]|uniref:tail fiber domain-containing protein n=1 Tax=Stenotrophomonas sp. ATs4 TaxID=3402766 RepID=UPI003F7185CF
MLVLTNTAGASAATPPASKTTLFVDASGVPSTKNSGGTVTPLLTGPAAAAAYQPLDSDLTGIAGLTYTTDLSPYYNGTAWATYTVTAVGRTLLAATTQAAQRTAIQAVGLVGNETVAGVKTCTSELRIQNIAPGFWLDESDGTMGMFAVLDNGVLQLQVRGAGFGPYVDQIMQIALDRSSTAFAGTTVRARVDNAQSLGSSTFRWTTVFATNTTISTSDARLKTEPRPQSVAERKAGSALAREAMIWEWLTGDRLHAGPTVQAAMAVMEAHGLDPFSYSFICYDEWEAEEATYDEEGNELTPAREAGDRYSFRKEELLCFMVSALAAENDLQAAKVEALDARLAALEAKA